MSDIDEVGQRRKPKKDTGDGVEQPPLTPMIDVTFQLLIFFMVTIEFRAEEGQIPGSLPQTSGRPPAVPPVLINIKLKSTDVDYDTCQYIVDNNVPLLSAIDLQGELVRLKGEKPDASIVIKTDQVVRWNFCVEAFNAAVRAKFTKIGFGPQRD